MKIILIITISFCVFSCQTEKKDNTKDVLKIHKNLINEIEVINKLSFPNWIEGVWQNTAESNTKRIVTYAFYDRKLTIRQGLNFQVEEKFIQSYKDYKLSERQSDSSYLITLRKNNYTVDFEFKLKTVEWSDKKVLTYSIVEDGELKREHLKSIQCVLTKI